MRSAVSSNDVRTIMLDNFRKYWTIPALGTAIYLLCGLVPMLLWHSSEETGIWAQLLTEQAYNMNAGYVIANGILGVGSGMTVFSYLQNPAASNYMHSLPIKRDRLLAAGILSGLVMIAVPVLINGIIMTVVAGNLLFVKWAAITAISCFSMFAITMFAGMLSGNTLMHLFNAAFFNGFVSIFILMFVSTCDSMLTGYAYPENWTDLMFDANPLSAFIGESMLGLLCVIYLAVFIAALLLTKFFYNRRKIERTGESVMFPWVRGFLIIYCVFCGSVLVGLLFSDIVDEGGVRFGAAMCIAIFVSALLIFIIGSVLLDRTAKIFTKRNLLPAVLALAMAFAFTFGLDRDVTGYSSRIPDADAIETVYMNPDSPVLLATIDSYNSYGWNSCFDSGYYDLGKEKQAKGLHSQTIGMHSPEAIEAVRQLHGQLIDQQTDTEDGDFISDIDVLYKLKNGRLMHRQYTIHYNVYESGETDLSKEMREAAAAYYESAEFKEAYSLNKLRKTVFPGRSIRYYPEAGENDLVQEDGYDIPRKYAGEIRDALEADFQESTYEQSRHCKAYIVVGVSGSSWQDIAFPVPDSGKHFKAWIKEHEDLLK